MLCLPRCSLCLTVQRLTAAHANVNGAKLWSQRRDQLMRMRSACCVLATRPASPPAAGATRPGCLGCPARQHPPPGAVPASPRAHEPPAAAAPGATRRQRVGWAESTPSSRGSGFTVNHAHGVGGMGVLHGSQPAAAWRAAPHGRRHPPPQDHKMTRRQRQGRRLCSAAST